MVYLTAYMRSRGANQVHVVGGAAASVAKQRRAPLYVLQRAAQWHSLTLSHTLYGVSARRKYRTHALLAWMGFVAFCAPRNKMPSRFRISCATAASSVCYDVEPKHFVYALWGNLFEWRKWI
jgi:hypothetical protein